MRARMPVIVMATVGVVLALVLAYVANFAVQAARRADRATTCNGLLLTAIAERTISDRARDLRCDVLTAQTVIDRGLARDRAQATDQKRFRALLLQSERNRLALERQLARLGVRPVTARPTSGPSVRVVIPTPSTMPAVPATPSPSPSRTPTPRSAPTPVTPPPSAPLCLRSTLLPDLCLGDNP